MHLESRLKSVSRSFIFLGFFVPIFLSSLFIERERCLKSKVLVQLRARTSRSIGTMEVYRV